MTEKIYRQLVGQSSLTAFMSIKHGYNSKKVTFDTQDSLDDKMDKLTSIISKLTAQNNDQNKQIKLKIYQSKWKEWIWNYYDQNNYDQRNY